MPRTERIAALIVDDERLARDNLRHALRPFAQWRVAGECESVAEAARVLSRESVDVIFLDVQMPRESGLALARSLTELPEPPVVVFVTAFETYAIDAFELHALDYLLKPFDDERLAQCVARVEQLLQLRERASYGNALRTYLSDGQRDATGVPSTFLPRLSVKSVGRIDSVRVADVRWIGAAGNYVELHLKERTMLHRVTLSALEARLDPAEFVRVHRRSIVRRDECKSLTVTGDGTYALRLHCGARVAVSERFVAQVRIAMGL